MRPESNTLFVCRRSFRSGFTLVELIVCMAIFTVLLGLILSGIQNTRAAAANLACKNNLKNITLAMHNYHQAHHHLPPGNVSAETPRPMAGSSWLVFILPYMEQSQLWNSAVAADTAIPIYATKNRFVIPPHTGLMTVVPAYTCPADTRLSTPRFSTYTNTLAAFTSYLGVNGGVDYCELDADTRQTSKYCGLFGSGSKYNFSIVTDGLSNTLFIGERPPPNENTHGFWYGGFPDGTYMGQKNTSLSVRETNYDQFNVIDHYNGCKYNPDCNHHTYYQSGSLNDYNSRFHFWSLHSGGANFSFVDGSVRFLKYSLDPLMPALASRAGGEIFVLE
jgi:prepilin-type N-terminal cleavage/methylation domain-containing protein/prepilin-type processing-associated H-X9-DG protein